MPDANALVLVLDGQGRITMHTVTEAQGAVVRDQLGPADWDAATPEARRALLASVRQMAAAMTAVNINGARNGKGGVAPTTPPGVIAQLANPGTQQEE